MFAKNRWLKAALDQKLFQFLCLGGNAIGREFQISAEFPILSYTISQNKILNFWPGFLSNVLKGLL